jgi:cation/acetate symporter
MKGITYTQVAQYCVLIFAYMVPAIFISFQTTGNPIPQLAFGSDIVGEGIPLLHKLDEVVQGLGFNAFTEGSESTIDGVVLTLALLVGTAGLPHVIVRFFTVPKVADARKSAGWALLFITILYTTAPAVGSLARLNLMNTIQPGEIGSVEGNLSYEERPRWFKTWEKTGLLKFDDKNGDGRIQYYNDKNKSFDSTAESYGWKGNELKVDRDIMVLANPEIANLPNWVIALIAAGGIAAGLSKAPGLLLVISSSISHDLVKGIIAPDVSEKKELMIGRIAAAVAILIAGYLGVDPPGFVAQVVALAFGLAASSLFPAILLGIFYKKANKIGAIAGMLVGITFTMTYIYYFKFMHLELNSAENWLFGISPEGIGSIGMLLNFIVTITVSKFTGEPPQEIQEMVESIRVPKII